MPSALQRLAVVLLTLAAGVSGCAPDAAVYPGWHGGHRVDLPFPPDPDPLPPDAVPPIPPGIILISADTERGVSRENFSETRKQLARECWAEMAPTLTGTDPDKGRCIEWGFYVRGASGSGFIGTTAKESIPKARSVPEPSDLSPEDFGIEDGDKVSITYYVIYREEGLVRGNP